LQTQGGDFDFLTIFPRLSKSKIVKVKFPVLSQKTRQGRGTSGDLHNQVAGKDKLIVEDAKQCTDEKNVMKAQFRKSKRRWFVIGYVAGFVSRQAIKSYLGF